MASQKTTLREDAINKGHPNCEEESLQFEPIGHPLQESLADMKLEQEEEKSDTTYPPEIKKRKSRADAIDIKPGLLELRKQILDNKNKSTTEFTRSTKKTRFASKTTHGRRSKYIGVSKNNIHWQALINVDRKKKYIGTFIDEVEAARAYDIYSLAIKGKEACLNFDYTVQEMLENIEYYLTHNCLKP
ncbi:unnamed protein product [Moneuplotes crassus]|uniref:AP2/ERF domain-containing protein n=1 Tax=Euplotes crassus TaxID=5936 RepID=A0AAD1XLJ0_EUPCR|nr:unnamed protein product [Moneuplotes crassus]